MQRLPLLMYTGWQVQRFETDELLASSYPAISIVTVATFALLVLVLLVQGQSHYLSSRLYEKAPLTPCSHS